MTEYSWDYRNRLTRILIKNSTGTITRQADYAYDAFNRRIRKIVDNDGAGPGTATTDHYIYDRDHIKMAFRGTSTTPRYRFLHGFFSYTGRELDSESGLYFYRSRYYNSSVGRFIGEDWISLWGEALNLS